MTFNLDFNSEETQYINLLNNQIDDVNEYDLTVTNTEGGTVEPSGTTTYPLGTVVPINATVTDSTTHRFKHWLINGIEDIKTLTYVVVNRTTTAIANFVKYFRIDISSVGGGTTYPISGSYEYDDGDELVITATPNEGSEFNKFTVNGIDNIDNPLSLIVNSYNSVISFFRKIGDYLQSLTYTYITDDGTWYQNDSTGDRDGEVYKGSYLQMNGVNNYILYGNEETLQSFTRIIKFKPNLVSDNGALISKSSGVIKREYSLFKLGSIVRFSIGDSTGNWAYNGLNSGSILQADKETIVVATYNGSLMELYVIIDGVYNIYTHSITTTIRDSGVLTTVGADSEGTTLVSNIGITEVHCVDYNMSISEIEGYVKYNKVPFDNLTISSYYDEKDGDTAYDISSNGNHGTINGTLTNIRQEDNIIYSYNNEFGYNDNSGQLVPASQFNLVEDVLGNTLENIGRVSYDAQLVESNTTTTDGVTNYLNTNYFPSLTLSVIIWKGSILNDSLFGTLSTNNSRMYLGTQSGKWRLGYGLSAYNSTTFSDTDLHTFIIHNGCLFVEDINTDVSTKEKVVDVISNATPVINVTPISSVADQTFYLGGLGGISTIFTNTENLYLAIYEYDGSVITPAILRTNFSEGYGNHYNLVDGSVLIPQGTLTNYYTTSDNQRPNNLFDGFTQCLNCTEVGITYIESTQAYGTWEFDINTNDTIINYFIASNNTTVSLGYRFIAIASGALSLSRRTNSSAIQLFVAPDGTLLPNTPYRIKIIRNSIVDEYVIGEIGTFAVYIKGGSFGQEYVIIDVSGGSGTNPVTDNIHTTSTYSILDLDTNDQISNYKQDGEVINLFDFTSDTGRYDRLYLPIDPTGTGEELTNIGIGESGEGHNRAETKYLQPTSYELYNRSLDFDTNPWFDTSGNPITVSWEDIYEDYESKDIWVSDFNLPLKYNWTVNKK